MESNQSGQASTPTTPAGGPPEENAIATATVVRLTETAAVVDFGWKVQGQVPFADFPEEGGKPAVKVGDRFEVLVEALGDDPAKVVLSKDKAARLRTWDAVVARLRAGGQVEGTVLGRVPGGYTVDVGLPAFLPGSQSGVRRTDDPEAIVGQALPFEVSEFNEKKMKIVLTRRALAEKEAAAKKAALLARLKEGAVLEGTVKSLAEYGAFVDVGGIDGLLHVSQMSWGRINHPSEAVRVGQQLQVQVLKFDPAANKLSLGLRQLQQDPWAKVQERLRPGSEVEGKVTNLTEFGAFVELAPGVEGLIHVSEMSWTKKVKHPSDVLKSGEPVKAVVLLVDPEARRISLGLRQLQPNPWKVLAEKYPEGSRVKGKVRGITDFGVFVELEEGIEGLVHISELSWTEKVKHPGDLYKAGDEVEAQVLQVDPEDQRISLGIKQLQPSPWQSFVQEHPVNSRMKGKVTRVVDFGAFVELAPGIEGLVHVSELREERVERALDVVKPGDEIEVQILEIDPGRRKVSLSVKALTQISREEYAEHLKQTEVKTSLGDVFRDKLQKK